MDTFSRVVNDTTFTMSKPANFMILMSNSGIPMKYRSTDPVAHSVTYDTLLYQGTVSPFGYHLIYYYLADSCVYWFSGKTLSSCGADFFYQLDGTFSSHQ